MMNLSLSNVILFMGLTWGTNIAFNLLYVLKRYIPKVSYWDKPIDAGLIVWDKKRLIGESTTVFGLIVAFTCSLVAFYSNFYTPIIALATPFLVYAGHMIGSFIKRRMGKDGSFVPFVDHGDYVFLSGLILSILGYTSFKLAIVCLLLTYVLHPIVTLLAFKLGLREHSY